MQVQVLLSTFNGETFLIQQLNSILQQKGVDVSVLIRDDGSHDKTVDIIKDQMKIYPNIYLIEGENIGIVPSYFALMQEADPTCSYFAFCDQDDIWLPDKLSTAVNELEGFQQPALFASPAFITSDGVQIQGQTPIPYRPLSLGNALVQNRLIGCTIVFNAATLILTHKYSPNLDYVNMHDWWLYLIVSTFGTVVFHKTPLILYRQHSMNVVGLQSDGLRARIKRFSVNQRKCSQQARAFLKAFEPLMDSKQKSLVNMVAHSKSLPQRVILALSGQVYRQSWLDNLILKILLILNRI